MLVAAMALAGAMATSLSATAASASSTDTARADAGVQTLLFRIEAEYSGKCLAAAPIFGAVTQQRCQTAFYPQRWRIDGTGIGNTYTLKPEFNPGVCLGVSNAGTSNGTPVRQFSCASQASDQRWDLRFVHGSYYELRPAHAPHMCLDVKNDVPEEGAPTQLWTCLAPAVDWGNQHFRFLSA